MRETLRRLRAPFGIGLAALALAGCGGNGGGKITDQGECEEKLTDYLVAENEAGELAIPGSADSDELSAAIDETLPEFCNDAELSGEGVELDDIDSSAKASLGRQLRGEDTVSGAPPPAFEVPSGVIRDLREQGEQAAARLGTGFSDLNLSPSEKGAKLLIDNGYVDKARFCAADEKVLRAEAIPEAEAAFAQGWDAAAQGSLRGMGTSLYYALGFTCLP